MKDIRSIFHDFYDLYSSTVLEQVLCKHQNAVQAPNFHHHFIWKIGQIYERIINMKKVRTKYQQIS